MNKYENLKKYFKTEVLTVGYIILVCIGYLEKSLYFDVFEIDISQYLNFQEYLLIFLPVGSTLIVVFIGVVGYLLIITLVEDILNIKLVQSKPDEEMDGSETEKKLWLTGNGFFRNVWKVLKFIIFFLVVFIPWLIMFIYQLRVEVFENFYNMMSLLWVFIVLFISIVQTFVRGESPKTIMLGFLGGFILVVLFMIIDRVSKVNGILEGKPPNKVEIYQKDSIIKSNENLVFIGSTKEYIFLRKLSSGENIIIPMKDVNKLITKKM